MRGYVLPKTMHILTSDEDLGVELLELFRDMVCVFFDI
jgi:hypothetical protein